MTTGDLDAIRERDSLDFHYEGRGPRWSVAQQDRHDLLALLDAQERELDKLRAAHASAPAGSGHDDASGLLTDVQAAVEHYRRVYPPPNLLSENLRLAVRGAALAEAASPADARRWSAIRELANEVERRNDRLHAVTSACSQVLDHARRSGNAEVFVAMKDAVKRIRDAAYLPGAEENGPERDCSGPGLHAGPWTRIPQTDSLERCEACGHVSGK